MYQQYYYIALYLLRQAGQFVVNTWWWYVDIVHIYSLTAITVLLTGVLFLTVMAIKRQGIVTVVAGEELHNLIRAMRGRK